MVRYEPHDDGQETSHCRAWHLFWMAAVGCNFLADPLIAAKLRGRLIDAHQRLERDLVFFCILPSEIHVISRLASGDAPGAVARAVGSVVARWYRGIQAVRNPVFAGPFNARRLQSEEEERRQLLMLSWRPVFKGWCRTPSHHPDGSLRITLGLSPARGFDARPALQLFGEAVVPARAAMRQLLARRPSESEFRQWELSNGIALAATAAGSTSRIEVRSAHAAALIAASPGCDIPGALRSLEAWVTARASLPASPFLHKSNERRAARGRALVACLAVDMRLCPAVAVARHFGRSKATLSEQMKACRSNAENRQILSTSIVQVVRQAAEMAAATANAARGGPGLRAGV